MRVLFPWADAGWRWAGGVVAGVRGCAGAVRGTHAGAGNGTGGPHRVGGEVLTLLEQKRVLLCHVSMELGSRCAFDCHLAPLDGLQPMRIFDCHVSTELGHVSTELGSGCAFDCLLIP